LASNPGTGSREPGAVGSWFPAFLLIVFLAACGGAEDSQKRFESSGDAEAIARITIDCGPCDWAKPGSEAVVLAVTLDDRPPVHVPIVRTGRAEYRVMLGAVTVGSHVVAVTEEPNLTAASLRGKSAVTWSVDIKPIPATAPIHQALSLAPFVYARPDTIGTFTDVPLLMWYEIEPTDRGTRYRYSVIFSNEDGGTPADRLMATWGRTTDIEYIYSVEVGANGSIVSEDMQAPKHEILPFKGQREGGHPLLWVSTENNMVLDHGTTSVRYAPAPMLVNLENASRETVMDANPWTYEVMAKELLREGKIVADVPPGQGAIPDLRRFVFLEACGEAGTNAITASVNVDGTWHSSDRDVPEYRIVRDGCFRAAIPLPGEAGADDVSAIRFQAHARKDRAAGASRITRLNRVFSLDDRFMPMPSLMQWEGSASLTPGGKPLDIPVR
jgi:hypothetical protein